MVVMKKTIVRLDGIRRTGDDVVVEGPDRLGIAGPRDLTLAEEHTCIEKRYGCNVVTCYTEQLSVHVWLACGLMVF